MKKVVIIVLAAAFLLSGDWIGQSLQVAEAAPHGVHTGVGRGGSDWRGGGGGWHGGGGGWHGGYRGHGGGNFNVWFGPSWWWDPFYYPYYSSYPYYNQPQVVIQQPQEYVVPETRSQDTGYWYYCQDAKGYYPYVKRCPGGWIKVVPSPPAGEEGP
ncbi:hypothetical protein GMLC_43250 [Geomonas limicola]|uniref:Lipoprotein n=1 Tax=Geomonas limicola TaxID=2740186 RepID=A0A6V8NDX6_9BACT|nr:hypothetical protein [Geomonas limicola]GFO70746.1 hypothetical protein GMLC_43250 [Geomonas limicola]